MSTLVVCRTADDLPRYPNTVTGYFCRTCGAELAILPPARELINAGGIPYCNPCGFAAAEKAQADGLLDAVCLSPEASQQLVEDVLERMDRHERN